MAKLIGGLAVGGQLLVIALGDSLTVPMAYVLLLLSISRLTY